MKMTFDLNGALLGRAKALAAQERTTITRLIEDGLRWRLRQRQMPIERVRLPVFRGKGGLAPGLDGSSNRTMREATDHDG